MTLPGKKFWTWQISWLFGTGESLYKTQLAEKCPTDLLIYLEELRSVVGAELKEQAVFAISFRCRHVLVKQYIYYTRFDNVDNGLRNHWLGESRSRQKCSTRIFTRAKSQIREILGIIYNEVKTYLKRRGLLQSLGLPCNPISLLFSYAFAIPPPTI